MRLNIILIFTAVILIVLALFYIINALDRNITTRTINQSRENECEIHGGKCYGFGDFVAEDCKDHGMVTLPYKCPSITVNTQCCK